MARPGLLGPGEAGETKARILDAAYRRLAAEGYAALSVREIARDAGVNHALINYHFGSKDQLVIAVLDEANRQLLARQRAMYAADEGFARKWARACEFYRGDLASGFVRVQAELWAASFSNAELREKFLPRILAWKKVVGEAVAGAATTLAGCGVSLPPPFTPQVITAWITDFWIGMEFADLLGRSERFDHKAALEAMHALLEGLDARVREAAKETRTRKRR